MKKSKKRILLLDKLRGIAVFFMILAHSVVFFNFNSNQKLDYISRFGDTIAFTFFLFVSSAVGYLSYIHTHKHDKTLRRRTINRIFMLLIGYWVIGITVSARSLYYSDLSGIIEKLVRIILFIDLPSYSEFLFPFIVYGLLTYIFRRQLKALLSNSLMTVLLAISLYLLGAIVHGLDIPNDLAYITSLFAGYKDWFRFPILQYAPVYLLGMLWMRLIVDNKMQARIKYSSIFLYFSLLALVLGLFINNFTNIYAIESLLTRWPPTPFFVLTGLIIVLISSLLIESTKSLTLTALIQWGFNLLGKKAFLYYIVHIVLLYLYRYFLNEKIDNPYFTLGLFVALLVITIIVSKFIGLIFDKSERKSSRIDDFILDHKLELFLLVLVTLLSAVFLVIYDGQKVDINDSPDTLPIIVDNSVPYWWDDTYKANRQISIQTSTDELRADDNVSFIIDHKSLVDQGKSRIDGLDLRVVSFAFGEYEELKISAIGLNTSETQISFPLQREISINDTDSRYFLYYGNEGTFLGYVNDELPELTSSSYQIAIGEEVLADIVVNMSREWILKGKGVPDADKVAKFTIELSNIDLGESEVVAKIITDKNTVTLETELIDENKYAVNINGDSLDPGSYLIQAEVTDTHFVSRAATFYISYPLYVTWTMDWEGFDVTDQYLNSMSSISTDYGMPITQFFNPRIFVADEISESRRQRLVDWVLERQANNGDEIGLHLHMHYDLIEAVGIPVRMDPRWGEELMVMMF